MLPETESGTIALPKNPCEDVETTIRAVKGDSGYAIVESGKKKSMKYLIEPVGSVNLLKEAVKEKYSFNQPMLDCCMHAIDSKFS